MKRRLTVTALVCLLTFAACASKPATPGQPVADSFTTAARAADDIALAVKLLTAAESNLERQKMITAPEGLRVIDGLAAVQQADVRLVADLTAARKSGDRAALGPALQALRQAVVNLNDKGVLGIKSPEARVAFQTAMNTLNLALATLQAFVAESQAPTGLGGHRYVVVLS